ncbi:hypothetical protein ACIQM4_32530 [Streptomyces sp. NPDC091272]|uniref:hypothetical protein n=1 Tax=Streptomyces sp. NPDC091272 TaxID=3365981 RepID=UPI003811B681
MQRTRQTPIRIQLPTPSVAQCTYGAMTAVLSTLAMILLSQTTSGAWIAVIACAALGLGLLVAMTVPISHTRRTARSSAGEPAAVPAPAAPARPGAYDGVRVPGPRARSSVGEHSLPG